jgi:hypothetical protein
MSRIGAFDCIGESSCPWNLLHNISAGMVAPNPICECPRYWVHAVAEQGTGPGRGFSRQLSAGSGHSLKHASEIQRYCNVVAVTSHVYILPGGNTTVDRMICRYRAAACYGGTAATVSPDAGTGRVRVEVIAEPVHIAGH